MAREASSREPESDGERGRSSGDEAGPSLPRGGIPAGAPGQGAVPGGRPSVEGSRLELTRHLVDDVLEDDPGEAVAAVALGVVLGVVQGASLLLLIPLLDLAGVPVGTGSVGQLGAAARAGIEAVGLPTTLPVVLATFILLQVGFNGLRYGNRVLGARIANRLIRQARQRLHRDLTDMDWAAFQRLQRSRLAHGLTDEAFRVGNAAYLLVTLLATVVVGAVYALLALRVDPVLTLGALAIGAGLLAILRHLNRRVQTLGEDLVERKRDVYDKTLERLDAMKLVKIHGPQDRGPAAFDRLVDDVAEIQVETERTQARTSFALRTGVVLVLSALVLVALGPFQLGPGALLFLLFLFAQTTPLLNRANQRYQTYLNHLASMANLRDIQATAARHREARQARGTATDIRPGSGTGPPVGDADVRPAAGGPAGTPTPGSTVDAEHPEARDPTAAPRLEDAVTFEDVTFRYDGDEPPALEDFTDRIPADAVTLVHGPSGAGKTTLADLAMGFLQPDEGRVQVDGQTLTPARARAWRRHVGYVPQEPYLLDATVRENLAWANPDADETAMREALEEAAALGFVDRLTGGLDAPVGERGSSLSGGERQRVALAMALVRDPELLVLDEPTSELDPRHEEAVMDALAALGGDVTVLLVSHDADVVDFADHRIAVAGPVVEASLPGSGTTT